MKRWMIAAGILSLICLQVHASVKKMAPAEEDLAIQNLNRAIILSDYAFEAHFQNEDMKMARYFNPKTGSESDETGSISFSIKS